MANIKVNIMVNEDAETELLGDVGITDKSKNCNVGIKTNNNNIYTDIPKKETNSIEGLSLGSGYLIFNSNGNLSNVSSLSGSLLSESSPIDFVFGATDDKGNYEVKLYFENAQNLDKIVIFGNEKAGQFPIEAYIDSAVVPIYSDDNQWAIKFEEKSDRHTIRFTKWNRSNYNACISLIRVMLKYYEASKFNGLKSVESTSQSSSNATEISYGILSNYASIDISDSKSEIKDLINDGIIDIQNIPIVITMNGSEIQNHIVTESKYLSNSLSVSFDCSDIISKWSDKKYDRLLGSVNVDNLYILLCDCLKILGYDEQSIDKMLSTKIVYGLNNITGSVKEYLQAIRFNSGFNFLVKSYTNINDIINDICTVSQLIAIEDNEGNIKFISARPIEPYENIDKIIVVPSKNQRKQLSSDLIVRNKKDCVLIQEFYTSVTDLVDDSNSPDDITEASKSVFVYTDYISFTDQSNWSKYNISKKVIDGDDWLVGSLEQNYIAQTSFDKIVSLTDDYFCVAKIKVKSTLNGNETEASIGGECFGYTSLDNFINNLYNVSSSTVYVGGYIKTNYDNYYSSIFSKMTTFIFAIRNTDTDIATHRHKLLYGTPAEGQNYISYDSPTKYGNGNIEYNADGINFFHIYTKINGKKISEIFANNILNDYANGIRSASITLNCLNYFYENGELAKDYIKGQIINIGDILRIDKDNSGSPIDNIYWKVVGRTFRYSGVPEIDLDLQEVKFKAFLPNEKYNISTELTNTYVQIKRVSSKYYVPLGIIDANATIYEGDVLTFTLTPYDGKTFWYATITRNSDGYQKRYESGDEYIVGSSDITITAVSGGWTTIIQNKTISGLDTSTDPNGCNGYITIDGLVANKLTRFTGYVEAWSPTLNGGGEVNINNYEFGTGIDEYIYITKELYDNIGEVAAYLEFKIFAPKNDNKLEYSNYTSNTEGSFNKISIKKIEQFL